MPRNHYFDAYVMRHGLRESAERFNVTVSCVNHWRNGAREITARRAREMQVLTDGELQARLLRPDLFEGL